MLDEALKHVCVLGAAGKMGSGIALLLLQEMARLEAETSGNIGEGGYRLQLIDSNAAGLNALRTQLRQQIIRFAEGSINRIRRCFTQHMSLVSNEEIIRYFVTGAMDLVHYDTVIREIEGPALVFEAIVEDVDVKCSLLRKLATGKDKDIFFFSNTSSIPIHILNEKGQLQHQIVGFHFYNPPAVQKLVELIIPKETDPHLKLISIELARRLKKTVVNSNDIAGFIGNGHFIREIMYACEIVHSLSRIHPLLESVYLVNKVTQDFLIRPMGTFQLIDYVGLDVVKRICNIMNTYLPGELFEDPLLDRMFSQGIVGGQNPDGSQKNGFFLYEGNAKKGIYSLDENAYIPIPLDWDKVLGPYPEGHASWKQLQRDSERIQKLQLYFDNLGQAATIGADLALGFLQKSKEIARMLISQGVAANIEDVDTVLENGFFHLYGPDADWLKLGVRPRS